MPILEADIKYKLSGGGINTDVNLSLGGAKSTTLVTSGVLHNLFDLVKGDEASSGAIEYRCLYIENSHASLPWDNVKIWVVNNSTSTDTSIDIGVGSSTVNGVEQTIPDEVTPPLSIVFSAPVDKLAGLSLGTIPAGQHKSIWIRRTVNAGAVAYSNDACTLRVEGDTAA